MVGLRKTREKSVVQSMITEGSNPCVLRLKGEQNMPAETDLPGVKPLLSKKEKTKMEITHEKQARQSLLSLEKHKHVAEWVSKHSSMATYSEYARGDELMPPLQVSNKCGRPLENKQVESTSSYRAPVLCKSVQKNPLKLEASVPPLKLDVDDKRSDENCQPQQRPKRQRPPQKLERWKPLVDKGGNLKLQGHLVLNGDMVTGQVLTTKPVELWERERVVRTKDKKLYQLIGDMFDPSGDVPRRVKEIIQKGEAVDWQRLRDLLHQSRNYGQKRNQNGEVRISLSYPKNSANYMLQEPFKTDNRGRRGKKRNSNEIKPPQKIGGDIQKDSSMSLPAKRSKSAHDGSTPLAVMKAQQVHRKATAQFSTNGLSFNSPQTIGKRATSSRSTMNENVSCVAAEKYCMKKSSVVVQSTGQTTPRKSSVPSKLQTAPGDEFLKTIHKEPVAEVTPLRRSDRFCKPSGCACCKDCGSPHLQDVKHTTTKSQKKKALVGWKLKQVQKTNTQVRNVQVLKYKITGRPLTRSLTTRSMRSLSKGTESTDFTSPKRSPPWLWKSISPTPQTGTRSFKRSPMVGGRQLMQEKVHPAKVGNGLSLVLTQNNTASSSSLKKTRFSDNNQKKKENSKTFVKELQISTKSSEELPRKLYSNSRNGQKKRKEGKKDKVIPVKSLFKPNADVRKDESGKDREKFCGLVQKPDKNPPKKTAKKKYKNIQSAKRVSTKNTKTMNVNFPNEDSNSPSPIHLDTESVKSHRTDSSCGPSASVICGKRLQEMKAPRTLRERQLQDAQIEEMQQRVVAADEDDPLASLNLHISGVTNEQCDYTQLLTKRRYSKSDSCCTPPTCFIMDDEGNNEDAASSVATPSLLSWVPQRKAVQSYVQRQRAWNSCRRPKENSGGLSAAKVPDLSSMDYSVVRTEEKDSVSCASSFFDDQDGEN